MASEIKVLAWEQAQKCGGVKSVIGISTLPLLIIDKFYMQLFPWMLFFGEN